MKKKCILVTMILSTFFCLTGCQMANIPDMTEEETQLVSQYAANLILSYNKNYDTGIATEEEIQKDDAKRERQKKREEEKKAEEKKSEESAGEAASDTAEETTVTNADLAQFLGLNDISIQYVDYEICDSYPHDDSEDTYFAMDAAAGNKLLVAKFAMQNNSDSDQDIDILYQYPLFRLSINGGSNTNAFTTLLLDDLSTFKDTLTAGETRPVVLVVQIPEETAQNEIQTLALHVKLNNQNADISLQ